MERPNYDCWTELAFDPARLQRMAESERHVAVDSLVRDLLDGLRKRFWAPTKEA